MVIVGEKRVNCMIKIKIIHWAYGGTVEKTVAFEKVGEKWESNDGDITLELIEDN